MNSPFGPKARRILGHHITVALLIFVVALALRLVYVSSTVIDSPIRADAAKYAMIAVNLVSNNTYTHEQSETPDAFITPGYPLFLTAVLAVKQDLNSTYDFVLRTQSVLMALTAAIVFLLCLQFLPRWAAITGGLLTVFAPHMVTISGYMLTEALFTFIVCLSIYLVALGTRKENLVLLLVGAFFIGIGALVRPSYLLFPIVVAIVILLDKNMLTHRRLKFASLAVLVAALVWSPWSMWKADKDSSSNNAAASFALGSYPNLIHKDPQYRGTPYVEDPQFEAMAKDMDVALGTTLDRMRGEPGRYARWYLIGKPTTFWSWDLTFGQRGPFIYPVRSSIYSSSGFFMITLSLFKAIHPLFALLSLAAIVMLLRELLRSRFNTAANTEIYLVAGCITYFTLVHTVFAPLPRYSIPMHPLLYVAGLFAISKLIELKNSRDEADAN